MQQSQSAKSNWSRQDKLEYLRLLDQQEKRKPPWKPFPGKNGHISKQELALDSLADELFYGGAAGGGKTQLLLGNVQNQHRSIIFRRTYTQLDNIIEESAKIYGRYSTNNDTKKIRKWKNEDRLLRLGACEHFKDREKWQGNPYDYYGFDEITHFPQALYEYLTTWNRPSKPGQRCRIIVTGNPPTSAEGEWVISYWGPWVDPRHPNPAQEGELVWYVNHKGKFEEVGRGDEKPFDVIESDGHGLEIKYIVRDGERLEPRSRTFIQSLLDDNPYQSGTGYRAKLDSLHPSLRAKLRDGNFLFGRSDAEGQLIPSAWWDLAEDRWHKRQQPKELVSLGVDPSRGGVDETALAPLYEDGFFGEIETHPGSAMLDGHSVATKIKPFKDENPQCAVNMDIIGTAGGGAYDAAAAIWPHVNAVNVSTKSFMRDKSGFLSFTRLRDELAYKFMEALDPESEWELAIPPDRMLRQEALAVTWELRATGIKVEEKDSIKDKIGRSPDRWDAILLAFNSGKLNLDLSKLF